MGNHNMNVKIDLHQILTVHLKTLMAKKDET